MVYIYKKGKKPYYYLRASERKNNKIIVKDIAYLGSSIEDVKKSLKNPKYKDKIRKAYKTINNFIQSNHYLEKTKSLKIKKDIFLDKKLNEIEACKLHYNKEFQKNNKLTKNEILKNFIIEFAFNTTSIEGNTITLKEAKNLLENNLTPKNKTLREIYDIQNTERVFLNILNSKKEITNDFITKIHSDLMENIDNRTSYRTTEVRVLKANFKATPAPYIKTDMDLLLRWYNSANLHPLVLAIIFHHKFEKIHPFMDGNGRTGRILMNYVLMKNKYPPLIISKKNRLKYLKFLREADKSDLTKNNKENYFNLIQFTINEMIENYWNIFL
ncbi:MAG: Fic family protein [Nanoarchaeota archaeon]|nr:Fic family protein [Nanoarchaeota archaeon]